MPLPTRPIIDMLPLVIPFVPGCPDYTATQALRLAAVGFCEKSRVWREVMTVDVQAPDATIVTPDHAALHDIERAFWGPDKIDLEPVRFADVSAAEILGAPKYITQTAANSVTLVPFEAGTVTIYAILKPKVGPEFGAIQGGTTKQAVQNVVPEFIHEQYAQMIAKGAIYRLKMMPGMSWYDPQSAPAFMEEYRGDVAASFNKGIMGQQRAPIRSRAYWM